MKRVILSLMMVAVAACGTDPAGRTPVAPSPAVMSNVNVSGYVYGPDGASICGYAPGINPVRVRLVIPSNGLFWGTTYSTRVTCPAGTYTFSVPDGTYYVQVGFPQLLPADLAYNYLDPVPLTVAGSPVSRDEHVARGVPVNGQALLDGQPLEGMPLSLNYGIARNMVAAFGSSNAQGAWVNAQGIPLVAQPGLTYRAATCAALGTFPGTLTPPDTFTFPSAADAVRCELRSSQALAFTHRRTRLVMTPGPGDLGMARPIEPQLSQLGRGFGVQYPVAPGALPAYLPEEASQMYLGGLVIAMKPDIVLSAVSLCGHLTSLEGHCRTLGADAQVSYPHGGPSPNQVMWRYSDAGGSDPLGLEITQQSFDGLSPHDYILVSYRIRNTSGRDLTIYPGIFTDWDTNRDPGFDVGGSELGGRLLYQRNDPAVHAEAPLLGTVVLGDLPLAGRYFFANNYDGTHQTAAELVGALAGERMGLDPTTPQDYRYLQSVGPVQLRKAQSVEVWFAVVAGADLNELLANAGAAAADRRRGAPGTP